MNPCGLDFLSDFIIGSMQFIESPVDDTDPVFAFGIESFLILETFFHFFSYGCSLLVDFIQHNGGVESFPLCSGGHFMDEDR